MPKLDLSAIPEHRGTNYPAEYAIQPGQRMRQRQRIGDAAGLTQFGLRAGDCAAFPANTPNGHHLINRSAGLAICLEVGGRSALDRVVYSDIDLLCEPGIDGYVHRDGTPYPSG